MAQNQLIFFWVVETKSDTSGDVAPCLLDVSAVDCLLTSSSYRDITSNPCGILPFAVLSQSEKYMNKIECFKAVTLEMRNNKFVFQM